MSLIHSSFQVVIESVRGSSYLGDIAIDDLSMTQFCRPYTGPPPTAPPSTIPPPTTNPCPGIQYQCTDGTCIQSSKRCDYRKDCNDGSDEVNCGMLTLWLPCFSVQINTGKRTEWSPIRSVVIRVITKSDLLITTRITDRHWTTQSPLTN